ncbi:MAG: chromosomal replication initiator protein DnaA, partial [Bacteroidales bacterium]|nr:chromosomal replication initiator protein DnaA [Bacteroidales bacterium]
MTPDVKNEVWTRCLEILRDNLNEDTFKTWFGPIKPISLEDQRLTIEVPSDFWREYIEEHFIDLLSKVLRREIGPSASLVYKVRILEDVVIEQRPKGGRVRNADLPIPELGDHYTGSAWAIPGLRKLNIEPCLNPIYNFENFIEGTCNRLGRSAGLSIAANPGRSTFNPLFIYGG